MFFIHKNCLKQLKSVIISFGQYPRNDVNSAHVVSIFLLLYIIIQERFVKVYLHLHCTFDLQLFLLELQTPFHTFLLGCQCLCLHHHLHNPNHTNTKHNKIVITILLLCLRFSQEVCITAPQAMDKNKQ